MFQREQHMLQRIVRIRRDVPWNRQESVGRLDPRDGLDQRGALGGESGQAGAFDGNTVPLCWHASILATWRLGQRYAAFFEVRRLKTVGSNAVQLMVQSAYILERDKPAPAKGRIHFHALLGHVLRGTTPRPPP